LRNKDEELVPVTDDEIAYFACGAEVGDLVR